MGNNREYLIPRDTIKIVDNDFPTMWNGFRFGTPADFSVFHDDFYYVDVTEWIATKVGAGVVGAVDAKGGVLGLVNAAADNDTVNIKWADTVTIVSAAFVYPISGKATYYETRVLMGNAALTEAIQMDAFIGLAPGISTDVVGTPPPNGIFFRKDDGDAQLDFVVTKNNISSVAANIATVIPGTFMTLGFKITGIELIEFYVDGVKKGEFKTNIPGPFTTAGLTPHFQIQNGEAAIKLMEVDYVTVAQER